MTASAVNTDLTPDDRYRPRPARATRRIRRVVENDDYAAFTRRILAAHARRISHGDIEGLTALAALAADIDTALHRGHRPAGQGYSWADIAARLGVTRQAAQQRFTPPDTSNPEGADRWASNAAICYVAVCDACRRDLEDPDNDFVPHFDTADAATDYALTVGWQLDTDGHTWCHRCVAIARCLTDGHDYTVWMPCICNGTPSRPRPLGLRSSPLLPAHRLRRRGDRHPRNPSDDRRTTHARPLTATFTPGPPDTRRGCW